MRSESRFSPGGVKVPTATAGDSTPRSRVASGYLAHLLDSILANPVGRSGVGGGKGKRGCGEPYNKIHGL